MNIQIAFRYGAKDIFSRLVSWWQGGDSAHCEVLVEHFQGTYTCISSSYRDGGVRRTYMPLPASKWRIYSLEIADSTKAERWFEAHRGQNYDLLGLVGFVFRPVDGSQDKWFCSEMAASILGLEEPHRYDLTILESFCKRLGTRVQ